jgi:hypothetical protein
MTDTPTRLPTHDRQWLSVLDVRQGDAIPCVGTVEAVQCALGVVRIWTNWHGAAPVEFGRDAELWIDRPVAR